MNQSAIGHGYMSANAQAFTVAQFCSVHGGMSRTTFYELQKIKRGPRTFKVGRRTLISAQAAADWMKAMEAEATAAELDAALRNPIIG